MTQLQQHFPSIGYLGAGNMAGALLRGTVGRQLFPAAATWACDIDADRLAALRDQLGIHVTTDPLELVGAVQTLVLAVKPQDLPALLTRIAQAVNPGHRVISIAAGVNLEAIARHLPSTPALVRVMPNTPALVGAGAAGAAIGPRAAQADLEAALALFSAVGLALPVAEDQLDAVTALSGSGPAYVFRLIEVLTSGGEQLGLDRATAARLALQTVLGAARLAAESDEDPAILRQRVTSKGGTTAAALAVLEARGLEPIFAEALRAARDRSAELSRG